MALMLSEINLDLLTEWDYEKNIAIGIIFTQTSIDSEEQAYWKCSFGHSWSESVNIRIENKSACPYCSNKQVLTGFNDLATMYPRLLKEWDYAKNNALGINPNDILPRSRKQAWWKCSNCNFEWKVTIKNRTDGSRCPQCRFKINGAETGVNDLQTTHANLLKEWEYERNDKLGIKPTEVTAGSHKKVYWKCRKCEKVWKAVISSRAYLKSGCPKCAMKNKVRHSALSFTNPEILSEWNYELNDLMDISPDEITKTFRPLVWWKCSKGHEWQAVIFNRINNLANCPYCRKSITVKGENDLATKRPDLLKEWDYEKNDELDINPTEVSAGSGLKVWWKCSKGHEWQTKIQNRTSKEIGCPYCSNHKILSGYNDLATTHSDLLKEWNYKKNDSIGIKPTEVSAGTFKKVWWKCKDCGYEWQALITNRKNGTGCPKCYELKK